MRCYPTSDISFYIEGASPWQRCIHYGPSHTWKIPPLRDMTKVMYYWRDLVGVKMDLIKKEDLYIKGLASTRIRKEACLPLLYATGYRFIKILKAPPSEFKCAPSPVNLQTARIVKAQLAKKLRAERKAAKKAAAEAKKKRKEERKKAREESEKASKKK